MLHKPCVLVTIDYPPERGGVARYLSNLVIASRGLLDVFVPETHATEGPGQVRSARMFAPRGLFVWRPMIRLFRALQRRGYAAALVSHVLPVGTAAWLARWMGGPRYHVLLHGLDIRVLQSSGRKRWLARRILRRADSVIVNSQFVAGEIRSFDPALHPTVLTPGVEAMVFPARDEARNRCDVRLNHFVILSVARLVPRKGIDRLIQAMALLPPETRLVVIGDGDDQGRLEILAQPFSDRVRFISHATDEERNAWYAAADVFALPVREEGADVEGFGIVYLEAALAGLPTIAGHSGGATEAVVHGETGMVVMADDPRILAEAIRTLKDDPALRLRMGEAGRARALQDFQWADRWEALKNILWKS